MEKYGKKSVPIAHADDKRQITAVLAGNATGKYLPPQLRQDCKMSPTWLVS